MITGGSAFYIERDDTLAFTIKALTEPSGNGGGTSSGRVIQHRPR